MADKHNRVLARKGARSLTQAEIEQVSGVATAVLMTITLTNMGRDHSFDERAT